MRFFTLIIIFLLFSVTAHNVFAVEISFSHDTSIIQKDQEVVLDVTVSGAAKNTLNYIRPAFSHVDTPTSYFGFVLNHLGNWYNGSPSPIDPKQYVEVTINDEGSWSGQIKVKPDAESSSFKGNGQYTLKVGRYTASAGSISQWSEAKQIEIYGVAPTLILTATPPPTEKSTPASKITPSSRQTAVVRPLSNQGTSNVPAALFEEEDASIDTQENASESSDVLGFAVLPSGDMVNPTEGAYSDEVQVASARKSVFPSVFIIFGAVILIIGCGILLFRAYKKQKEEEI